MFQNLYPDEEYRSSYEIPYESYYQKGFRGILFDVDNTLVEHDQPVTIEAIALFEKLRKIGFEVCIISNNKEPRVKPLADTLGAKYVYKADKPSAKGYAVLVHPIAKHEEIQIVLKRKLEWFVLRRYHKKRS